MPIPVILKLHNFSDQSKYFVNRYLHIFDDPSWEIFINCDKDDVGGFTALHPIFKIYRTPQETRDFCATKVFPSSTFTNVAAAHLSTFQMGSSFNSPFFWNIDADDTFFSGSIYEVRSRFQNVQSWLLANPNCDGISADIHFSQNDDFWTFGVALMRNQSQKIINLLSSFSVPEIQEVWTTRNIKEIGISLDQYFEFFRLRGLLKLDAFYFDNMVFAHIGPNPQLAADTLFRCNGTGVYNWEARCRGDIPLSKHVVQF